MGRCKEPRKCLYCDTVFIPYNDRQVTCSNKICKNKMCADRYKERLKDCICSKCGASYKATDKQNKTLCKSCVRSDKYNYKSTYIQKIACRVCGCVVGERSKNLTREPLLVSYEITCDACKEDWRKRSSTRMKLFNPMYSDETKLRRIKTVSDMKLKVELDSDVSYDDYFTLLEWYNQKKKRELEESEFRKEQSRKRASDRMKTDNPMFNKDSVEKMKKTYKERLESGEIRPKTGKDHWGWRGGNSRTNANYIRSALKGWKRSVLENSNFTCQMCGKRNCYLNIHHKYPFRCIIEEAEALLGIDLDAVEFRSIEYNYVENWVIKYHENVDVGIVLCQDCHDLIDDHFHKSDKLEWGVNRENKKDNKREF